MSRPLPPEAPQAPNFKDFVKSIRFRPIWIDALRGYNLERARGDIVAGLVVGLIALPLAIAFAIASGADPRAGLITAALAGMLVAIFGGSHTQVAGPTGAFVVILYGITQGYGIEKLFVATFLAGIILFLMGLLRAGNLIKFIPYPVTTGFTAGIAVIIFLGQLQHILGLRLDEIGVKMPGESIGIVETIAEHLGRIHPHAFLVALSTIVMIQGIKLIKPSIPGPPVALLTITLAVYFVPGIHVQTLGDLFTVPSGLPTFQPLDLSLATLREVMGPAITIALLGAIESLLSAVVADGRLGTRHDSNQELMGQGIANVFIPFFGGIAVTGAIARTSSNILLGGRTPVAAFIHGVVVLAVLVALGPLVVHIPMAVLGGILLVVAWNMSERHRFRHLLKMPVTDAGVMLLTFGLTILVDLTVAVEVGMVLAAALFLGRMANLSQINVIDPASDPRYEMHSLEGKEIPAGVQLYSIDGPFFFGAAERFRETFDRLGGYPKVMIFRMRHAPYMDATGLNGLTTAVEQLRKHGCHVVLSAVQSQPFEMMMRGGFFPLVGDENVQPHIDAALSRAREILGLSPAQEGPGASSRPAPMTQK